MFLSRVMMFAAAVIVVAVVFPKLGFTGRPAPVVADVESQPVTGPAPPPAPASPRRVAFDADRSGHFIVPAVIDGRSLDMMVDTGATTIALTEATARRLGIRPARSDFRYAVSTANGTVMVAMVELAEVRVGGITVRDVAATVVPGDALRTNLLGMSFLGRLSRFEMAGDQLVLHR